MTKRDYQNALIDILEGMNLNKLVEIHNNYCEANRNMDDWIYNIDSDFNFYYEGLTPLQVAEIVRDVNLFENYYFWENQYGLCSDDQDLPFDLEAMSEWILESNHDFKDEDIIELLEDYRKEGIINDH